MFSAQEEKDIVKLVKDVFGLEVNVLFSSHSREADDNSLRLALLEDEIIAI